MDILKFIILSVACISGFMVTSYDGVAQEKGWEIDSMFKIEEAGFITIMGLMCQWGSVIISFFVNPWWSAFLVLIIGFLGNMLLTIVFKRYTRFIAIPFVIISFALVSLFAFSSSSPFQSSVSESMSSKNLDHFFNSIEYANNSNEVSNQLKSFEKVDKKKISKMIELKRKALNEAKLVNIEKIDKQLNGFKEHFKNEYMKGLKYYIEAYSENDNSKIYESHRLLRRWGMWYNDNYNKIRN